MTTYRLDRMFAPRSVAVVGASPRKHSVGRKILCNLKAAGFAGPIHLVNPNYAEIEADLPEVRELDLNPLLADSTGVIALDARVAVSKAAARKRGSGHPRFAIRPYPKEWERRIQLQNGASILLRPVRPEDEPLYPPFLQRISPEDLRLRFFAPVKDFSHGFIARFTQIDYARAMAFLAIDTVSGEMLGVGRLHTMAHSDTAEYAVLVRSDMKGHGIGWVLTQTLIDYAGHEGIRALRGEVLADNATMLRMCGELGFHIADDLDNSNTRIVTLSIAPTAAEIAPSG